MSEKDKEILSRLKAVDEKDYSTRSEAKKIFRNFENILLLKEDDVERKTGTEKIAESLTNLEEKVKEIDERVDLSEEDKQNTIKASLELDSIALNKGLPPFGQDLIHILLNEKNLKGAQDKLQEYNSIINMKSL